MGYIFDKDLNEDNRSDLLEFLRHQATPEWGGYKLFDGTYNHILQNPFELTDLIFYLKKHEQHTGNKIKKFLEVGFNVGFTNTILNKIFNFEEILAIDNFSGTLNGTALLANLRFKNLVVVCGDSTSERVIKIAKHFSNFDLLLIDGNHEYEIVKQDFENYKDMISPSGIILLHDIHSVEHKGIGRLWKEIIDSGTYNHDTIFSSDFPLKAGIGVLKKK